MTRGAVLCGLGTCLPGAVVTNAMLAEELDTSDEWIRKRTGIRQRHITGTLESTTTLAVEAGCRALISAGLSEVDAVVVATTTPGRSCPAVAPEVADLLGLRGVAAFDVSAVCTGFVYALATATGLVAAGLQEQVLVIGSDTFSNYLDPADRATRPLFGDGAGAVVLRAGEPDEPGALAGFDLGADGSRHDLLTVPTAGYFQMQGREVFEQAVTRMGESVERTLAKVGWAVSEVDNLVPHQANVRIIDEVATQLGVAGDRVARNVDRVGNTVAASIPLALAHEVAEERLVVGRRVVLTGFGAGLTWGSAALVWPDLKAVSN